MKTTDYKILWGELEELEADVKAAIGEGWQPTGGLCLKHNPDWDTVFYQAMVKYEAKPPVSDFRTMQMWVGG